VFPVDEGDGIEVAVTLGGSALAAEVGCVSTCPVPTMTIVPLLGIPLTTTNSNAGPGVSKFGFGGTCETCKTYVPSSFTV